MFPAFSNCFSGSWKPIWLRENSARLAREIRMSQQISLMTGSSNCKYSAALAPTVTSTFCPRSNASSEPYLYRNAGGYEVCSSKWNIFSKLISISPFILRSCSEEECFDSHPLSLMTLCSIFSLVDCSSFSYEHISLGASSAKMGAVLRMPCSVCTQIWYCLKYGSLVMRKVKWPLP